MPKLNDLSQLQTLFTQLDHQEVQTKKRAEAERIDREIKALEAQAGPVKTEELMDHKIERLVTVGGGSHKQSPVTAVAK